MASFVEILNSSTDGRPTPFGAFDTDTHFQEEADSMVLYIKRRLGDDIMTVELTSKQIWANFEEAVLEFSKQVNSHQAESYMSNILGLNVGPSETYKKNKYGHYYYLLDGQAADAQVDSGARTAEGNVIQDRAENVQILLVQDVNDPRFLLQNKKAKYKTETNSDTSVSVILLPMTIEEVDGAVPGEVEPIVDKRIGPSGKEQKFPRETLEYLIRRAEPYASEAFVGGVSNSVRGFIELEHDKQDYNIYKDLKIPFEGKELGLNAYNYDESQLSLFNPIYKNKILPTATASKLKINEIFHFSPQAAYRFFDTTSAINYLNNQFSFESFTPETVFYVLPVFEDLLRAGQLDISHRL